MADIDKRMRYFNGQFLEEADFNAEQAYLLDRQRRQNRLLHRPGIAEGLTVTANTGASEAVVSPGTAVDAAGHLIVLPKSSVLSLASHAGETVLVAIAYAEQATDPTAGGPGFETRWHEAPAVEIHKESTAPSESTHLRLARLVVGGTGTASSAPDLSVRRDVSARAGNRDLLADGAALDAHLANVANPHGVTAAQIGALLASDYAFGRREYAQIGFGSAYGNGATQTVSLDFEPKFLLAISSYQVYMGSGYHGGVSTGFADLEGNMTQRSGVEIMVRYTGVPYFRHWGYPNGSDEFFQAEFWDYTTTNTRAELAKVHVNSVSSTEAVIGFTRTKVNSSYDAFTNFSIDMQLIFFG